VLDDEFAERLESAADDDEVRRLIGERCRYASALRTELREHDARWAARGRPESREQQGAELGWWEAADSRAFARAIAG
jgi:hypothetical protein